MNKYCVSGYVSFYKRADKFNVFDDINIKFFDLNKFTKICSVKDYSRVKIYFRSSLTLTEMQNSKYTSSFQVGSDYIIDKVEIIEVL